jgi:hypothetical protein
LSGRLPAAIAAEVRNAAALGRRNGRRPA